MKKEELIEVLNNLWWRNHLNADSYQEAIEDSDILLNEINSSGTNEAKAVRQNEQTQEYCSCSKPDRGLTLGNSPYCRKCSKWMKE